MEECACLCDLGSSRGCPCPQECQRPAETAGAEGKRCPHKRQRPAEMAVAEDCLLQDLPVEMLVDIFASLPGTDLASLAQACTKFRHILHTDSIWFGVPGNLQKPEMIGGMSYREVYAKMFPYRNLLGLWQLDYGYRRLLNVVVDDGLCITGWMYGPCLNTHVDGPMQFEPSFRIHLTQRKSAMVEYMVDLYSFSHSRHMQIQKDRFSIRWIQRDPPRLRGGRGLEMSQEDRQLYDRLTDCHLYLPPSHQGDLIRLGPFQGKSDGFGLMIAMLSFHGKYAKVTKITGDIIWTLEVHLMLRIHLPDGKTFRKFKELSRVVQEIEEQVICEQQQQQQQQQENRTEAWAKDPVPSSAGREASMQAPPPAASSGEGRKEQPVPFVLPVGLGSGDQNYPRTRRMCFYSERRNQFVFARRRPAVFILFNENHSAFIWLEAKYFILFDRLQKSFQKVEAASPQAFLEMPSNNQSGPP
uniref:F-box domain-containing protein n=1 Tax=Myotis lucifugus TaxID=59463 RepID=G1Q129_MYOLU